MSARGGVSKRKLKNLLEFKDREQIRGLLKLASGKDSDNEISEILLKFITDTKWVILGLVEGPVLFGLMGVEKTEPKTGHLHYIAVRSEKEGLGRELFEQSLKKLKFKALTVTSPEPVKDFFLKVGFQEVDAQKNEYGATIYKLKWEE